MPSVATPTGVSRARPDPRIVDISLWWNENGSAHLPRERILPVGSYLHHWRPRVLVAGTARRPRLGCHNLWKILVRRGWPLSSRKNDTVCRPLKLYPKVQSDKVPQNLALQLLSAPQLSYQGWGSRFYRLQSVTEFEHDGHPLGLRVRVARPQSLQLHLGDVSRSHCLCSHLLVGAHDMLRVTVPDSSRRGTQ